MTRSISYGNCFKHGLLPTCFYRIALHYINDKELIKKKSFMKTEESLYHRLLYSSSTENCCKLPF